MRAARSGVRLMTTMSRRPRRRRVAPDSAPIEPAPSTTARRPASEPSSASARSRATETTDAPARSMPVSECTRLPIRSAVCARSCSTVPTEPTSLPSA